MATIVKHLPTGNNYVLIGTGFGAFQSKKPNWFLGDLMADTTEGNYPMVSVCDPYGKVLWIESSQIVVESVDGQLIHELFNE